MRFLRKTVILALAGFGAYQLYEMLSPKLDTARDQMTQAKERIEPALRDASRSVQEASREAASSVAGASKEAMSNVADATSSAAESVREQSTTGGSDATSSSRSSFGTIVP